MKFLYKITLCLLLIGGAASCQKREGNIILPGKSSNGQLGLEIRDTFLLRTQTVKEDSLPGNGLSYCLIGSINDPFLGKSTANMYADLILIEPNSNFPNTLTPDSAVLFIPTVDGLNHYGNRNYPLELGIYPIAESIDINKTYYQTDTVAIDRGIRTIYKGSLNNTYKDSVRYRKTKLRPYNGIRVKLSTDMAEKLMSLPKEAYETNDGLDKHFKGIAILPQNTQMIPTGEGCFSVFDVNNILSLDYRAKILLYYGDSNTFVFGFSGRKQTINNGKTGPYPYWVQEQLNAPDSTFEETYCQALSGVKTRIQIPQLFDLISQNNVAINNAYIEFSIKNYSEYFFAAPRLNLFQPASKDSRRNFLIEDAASLSNYGGGYNPSTGTYRFTITRHVQNLLNSKFFNDIDRNWGLYLAVPSDQPVIGARSIIDHTKTKLHVTYTKLN